jgi:tetratricopeptide (TPR) repeat protein
VIAEAVDPPPEPTMHRPLHVLVLRRDDHKHDSLGAVFLGAVSEAREVRRYVERYLGPAFAVRRVDPEGPALRVAVECSRFPTESQNLTRIARSLVNNGRNRAAADSFREALKLDPMNTEALKGQAALCALAGELPEAQDHWIRAGEIRGYDGEILRGLAVIALRTDRHGSAIQYLQDALVVNPNDDEAREMLEELRRQSELRFTTRSSDEEG